MLKRNKKQTNQLTVKHESYLIKYEQIKEKMKYLEMNFNTLKDKEIFTVSDNIHKYILKVLDVLAYDETILIPIIEENQTQNLSFMLWYVDSKGYVYEPIEENFKRIALLSSKIIERQKNYSHATIGNGVLNYRRMHMLTLEAESIIDIFYKTIFF